MVLVEGYPGSARAYTVVSRFGKTQFISTMAFGILDFFRLSKSKTARRSANDVRVQKSFKVHEEEIARCG